jgi:uncharacterized protein YndB with AHSA1/START domain
VVEAIRQGDIPGVQMRWRQDLPRSAEEIWPWLTEVERLERWLCARAEVDLTAGGAWRLESARRDAAPLVEIGELLEIDAPRRLSLAWRQSDADWQAATRVTLELHPRAGACELDVFHEGFEHLSLSTCLTVWEAYRRRWRQSCGSLAERVTVGL